MTIRTKKRKLSVNDESESSKLLKINQSDSENETGSSDNDEAAENGMEIDALGDIDMKQIKVPTTSINYDKPIKCMKTFRGNLKKHFSITDVIHFVNLANKNPAIVAKYVKHGGKVLEMVELLEKINRNNNEETATVFNAIQLNLMHILSDDTSNLDPSVQACKYLMKNHKNCFENLLNSSSIDHNKICVKLLIALVTLDGEIGKMVFPLLDVFNDNDMLKKYTTHPRAKDESEILRDVLIQFLLSFMIEGNTVLIRKLLEKKQLIVSLLPGLVYDNPRIVTLILETFLKNILKSQDITKTEKINLFDIKLITDLIRLLNWQGSTDEDSRVTVQQKTLEFLKVLLSSRKHGIVTLALTDFTHKKNFTQRKVLSTLSAQWHQTHHGELIIAILQACPELAGYFYDQAIKSFSGNNKCIDFVYKLLDSLTPQHIAYGKNYLKISDTANLIQSMVFSSKILAHVQELIRDDNFSLRLSCGKLLLKMFEQYKVFVDALVQWAVYKDYEISKFNFEISQHVGKYCPSIDTIIISVFRTLENTEKSNEILSHLEVTLDLLQIIYSNFPSFLEKTTSVVNYISMLKPIYNSTERNFKLELKMINFILEVEPESISAPTDLFDDIFLSFMKIYVYGDVQESDESKHSLIKMLKNTSLFENGEDEIILWLYSMKQLGINSPNIDDVLNFLLNVIKNLRDNNIDEELVTEGETTADVTNIQEIFYNIENGISVQGITEILNVSNIFIKSLKLLASMKKPKMIKKYFENLIFYLSYYLPNIEIIGGLSQKYLKSEIPDLKSPTFHEIENLNLIKINDLNLTDIDVAVHIYFQISNLIRNNRRDTSGTVLHENLINFLRKLKELNAVYFSNMLKYLFLNHYKLLNNFNLTAEHTDSITNFMVRLLREFNDDIKFNLTSNYRNKIINEIKLANYKSVNLENLNLFNFDADNARKIVEILLNQENSGEQINLLAFFLNRMVQLRKSYLQGEDIAKLIELLKLNLGNDKLETEVYNYMVAFPHSIEFVDLNYFDFIFETNSNISKVTTKFCSLLLERNRNNFVQAFAKLSDSSENIRKKELYYPIFNSYCKYNSNSVGDLKKLTEIYGEYKNGISKSIEKPLKSGTIYKENVIASIRLIELCMPLDECVSFISHKSLKLDSSELFQCQLIRAIHQKVINNKVEIENSYLNFINIWIQMMNIQLKRENVEHPKLISMIVILFKWIQTNSFENVSYTKIIMSPHWNQFARNSLKLGMNLESQNNSVLLRILAYLCDQLFYDFTSSNDEINTIFEMALSHSNFFEIMLNNKEKGNLIKLNLSYLLFVLVKKNANVANAKHIPIYLGAYNATLSPTDQYLLNIIKLYEQYEIKLNEYRPFIWGESAIVHYSLREQDDAKTTAIKEPPMDLAQSLFDQAMCDNSIDNYPIWRKLDTISQLPEINFYGYDFNLDDELNLNQFYNSLNSVEKILYKNEKHFDQQVLKTIPQKPQLYDSVYDPAFYIPLMSLIFSPESYSYPSITAQNGSLGLLIASMSSLDVNIRLAAGDALIRYRNYFESNRNFLDKRLWIHLFDSMQNGLGELSTQQVGTIPRPAYSSCLFLAKLANILSYPLNSKYLTLTNYLLITNSFDFTRVPEFITLFQSSDVKHVNHRYFILNILKNSLKTSRDFESIQSSFVLKAIMGFFASAYSDKTVDLLIISIINNCVRIPKLIKFLIDMVGILSWLSCAIAKTESFKFDTIDGLVTIMLNIHNSINILKLPNRYDIHVKLLSLHLKLLPKLSKDNTMKTLSKFIKTFKMVLKYKTAVLKRSDLEHLIDCCENYFGENLCNEIKYVMDVGCEYSENSNEFMSKLKLTNETIDQNLVVAVNNLRDIISNWNREQKLLKSS